MTVGDVASTATALRSPAVPDDLLLDTLVHRRRGSAPRGTYRMTALCRALGDPQIDMRAVRVVGTGGKTSIVRIAASLFQALGVPCGEATSPHLHDVAERIRLDGDAVRPAQVAARWQDLQDAVAVAETETGQTVTFFEAVTALGLRLFADHRMELAVVEAGIGGVGDATSVVSGDVVVLGRVGLDHPELGTTLSEVAAEKAGIVTSGGTLISATQAPETAAMVDRVVGDRGATLVRMGGDIGVETRRPAPGGQHVALRGLRGSGVRAYIPLRGAHQAANAAIALAAVQARLGTTDLDPDRLRAGLASVCVPGRMEVLARDGMADVVLDGAHDPDALRALVACLAETPGPTPTTIVFGIGGMRAPEPLVELLRPLDADIVVTAATSPSAVPAADLGRRLRACGVAATVAHGPAAAMATATSKSPPHGRIVVAGSLHLVGEVRLLIGVDATVP